MEELQIRYSDYVMWQKELFSNDNMSRQEEYWTNKFSGSIPVLDIPTDYSRTNIDTYEVNRVNTKIDKELTDRLKTAELKHDHSLFTLIISVLNILLWKYTGQDDIVIGFPTDGRSSDSLNNIVGLFSNILPIRNQISEGITFQQHFEIVENSILEAYENCYYPYEQLLKNISLNNQLNVTSLFSVMLVPCNMEGPIIKTGGVHVSNYILNSGTGRSAVDLVIYTNENKKDGDIGIEIEYSPMLFKKGSVERMLRHFLNIINEIAENPGIKLYEINFIDEIERQRILFQFNNPLKPYDNSELIHRVFEKQVESSPDNIAVVSWHTCLTYSELNKKANSLAHLLRKKGVTRETIVGILMENSANMVISIFAVLKAGGAYLPIDKKCPQDRIIYMLEDSDAKLLLVDKEMRDKLSFNWNTMVVSEDTLYNGSSEEINNINCSGDMAYIIYTSGTTGKPKGVVVEHQNVIAYVHAFQNEFHIGQDAIVLQQASCSFDVFVEEVYPALMHGGRIVIPKRSDVVDMDELCKIIKSNKVNVISCSPLMLNELNKYTDIDTVNLFISGGDVLKHEYISNLLEKAKVYNTYGPTETTVCVTYYNCNSGMNVRSIPIGKPILNYKVHILDSRNNLVPVGVHGELCISGHGVTRGYLNMEKLTREKFISNPFEDGDIIYKTGDLVKWLDDGNIEFLGRIDRQVKIRGYRIELAEIERKISSFCGIQDAIVTSNTDKTGNQYLCAYVISNGAETNDELRKYLLNKLPEYMVPSIFINVDKFPLTQNGKVDHEALLRLAEAAQTNVEYQAPRGDKEEKLSKVMREVFGIKKVGRKNNFFDLGGNSIKAIQIVAKLKNELSITINDIFEYPNIRDLARNINYKKCYKKVSGEAAFQKNNNYF